MNSEALNEEAITALAAQLLVKAGYKNAADIYFDKVNGWCLIVDEDESNVPLPKSVAFVVQPFKDSGIWQLLSLTDYICKHHYALFYRSQIECRPRHSVHRHMVEKAHWVLKEMLEGRTI